MRRIRAYRLRTTALSSRRRRASCAGACRYSRRSPPFWRDEDGRNKNRSGGNHRGESGICGTDQPGASRIQQLYYRQDGPAAPGTRHLDHQHRGGRSGRDHQRAFRQAGDAPRRQQQNPIRAAGGLSRYAAKGICLQCYPHGRCNIFKSESTFVAFALFYIKERGIRNYPTIGCPF